MPDSSVGQRFSQLIQQLGMSKNAFAISLDKTATVIQHLVDERNKPGFDLICKVFEVYPNVSKDWLLTGEGPMLLNEVGVPVVTAATVAEPAVAKASPPATPSFPAPLFAVSTARPPVPAVDVPASAQPTTPPVPAIPQEAVAASEPPVVGSPPLPLTLAAAAAPALLPPPSIPAPAVGTTAAPPAAPDATYLTAALHAQYLQHQLALAEQRNQHLQEQQQLMQQMLDLLRRPA